MTVKFEKYQEANDHLHYMSKVIEDIPFICDMMR